MSIIGVLLAGGTGSRLLPLTCTLNKHMLPVNGQPMLHWPLRSLALLGIQRVIVVLGGKSAGEVVEHFGSTYEVEGRTLSLAYVYQREAGGIGQALAIALPLAEELQASRVIVMLGDNVFAGAPPIGHVSQDDAYVVGIRNVDHPERDYGCIEVVKGEDGNKIYGPVEKPNRPPDHGGFWLPISGIYSLPIVSDKLGVLSEFVAGLSPSGRGEIEVTDILAAFQVEGRLDVVSTDKKWIDAGEHAGYRLANDPAFWAHPGVTEAK